MLSRAFSSFHSSLPTSSEQLFTYEQYWGCQVCSFQVLHSTCAQERAPCSRELSRHSILPHPRPLSSYLHTNSTGDAKYALLKFFIVPAAQERAPCSRELSRHSILPHPRPLSSHLHTYSTGARCSTARLSLIRVSRRLVLPRSRSATCLALATHRPNRCREFSSQASVSPRSVVKFCSSLLEFLPDVRVL